MWTSAFVIGSALVVAVEIAVAAVLYDGSDASDRAARVEERLDRELREWVDRSFAAPARAQASHRHLSG